MRLVAPVSRALPIMLLTIAGSTELSDGHGLEVSGLKKSSVWWQRRPAVRYFDSRAGDHQS
ncbi:hypothetical protein RRG08_010762 [Elysia crispata]|uniref:Uncharacterized protein n=1 Tax=Elysia crispata TaxID=231223 RepID=A0AAE1A435_9GAST|nr:hypothetical protein RRG08_010762 [Elysia crispata]